MVKKVDLRKEMIGSMQRSLKVIRQICNLSAQELGEFIGVTRQTINNIENFKTGMSITQYIAICAILDKWIEKEPRLRKQIISVLSGNFYNDISVGDENLDNSFYNQKDNLTLLDNWFLSFQNKATDFEVNNKNIFNENDLNILAKNYKIFANADILENFNSKLLFKKLGTALQKNNNKLIVPLRVIKYLQDNLLSTNTSVVISAKRGLNMLSKLQQKGVLDIRGEASDGTIDGVFKNVFYRHRLDYRLALLTQDKNLAREVMEFNNNDLEGFKIITAYMNENGEIVPFKDTNIENYSIDLDKENVEDIDNIDSDTLGGWDIID